MKTIYVTSEVYSRLSNLGFKSESVNDIIERLIDNYEEVYFEDFIDEQAAYYNERISQFEKGNYEGTREVDIAAIKEKYSL